MTGDPELLYAIKDQTLDQKLTPTVRLGYNTAGDLVEVRKTIDGVTHARLIDDPDVADKTVVKWVEYGAWTPT